MKVLFDASVIAEGASHRDRRTGIYRAARDVAVALATRSDITLSLSAARSWQAVHDVDALARAGSLPPVEVVRARNGRRLMSAVAGAHAALRTHLPTGPLEKVAAMRARTIDRLIRPLTATEVAAHDVFHLPAHWIPAIARTQTRYVVTIYDIIADVYPQHATPWAREAFAALRRSLAPTDVIVTDSEWVKSEVATHWKIPPERIIAAPLAASADLFHPVSNAGRPPVMQRYGIAPGHYFLGANRLESRKNVAGLVRAFVSFAREADARDTALVLAGAPAWDPGSIFETAEDRRIARSRVLITGHVRDEDLAALYSGARAFVFPSLFEGFGLPALEAMQCGTPVIASDRSSLPEVVGNAGLLVDPTDERALAAAMLRLLTDDMIHADLSRRSLERAAGFSWSRTADRTVQAYRAALAT